MPSPALIVLEDGAAFPGEALAGSGTVGGELVFTTSMTGYQEIATDPSYHGQLVAYTFPMNGNYGVRQDLNESPKAHPRAVIAREITNYRYNHISFKQSEFFYNIFDITFNYICSVSAASSHDRITFF